MIPPYFILFRIAFDSLVLALVLSGAYLVVPRPALIRTSLVAVLVALVSHSLFFALTWIGQGGLPLVSNFGSLSFLALGLVWVFFVVEWRYRLGILGTFILPIPTLFLLMGFRFVLLPAPPSNVLAMHNGYLAGHVAFSMLAYAFFTTAAGVALAYLVQHRQLKSRHPGAVAYRLPPLEELERLCFFCVWAGFVLLSVGMLAGAMWSLQTLGRLQWDAKVFLSLCLWLLYGFYLAMRQAGGFRGRHSAALLLLGFFVFFFGYYLANVYGGGHKFLN
jgi:ABC-type uncharacterized transport system permease subunit